jgi:uncharacterized membrane protein
LILFAASSRQEAGLAFNHGLRAALIGTSHFGAIVDAVVLAVVAVGLLGLGAWRFSKIEI